MTRLNIGCGKKIMPGWINIDAHVATQGVTRIDMFRFPWPFEDSSVDEILMSHFLEHVPDVVSSIRECHRILKPFGKLTIIVPHYRDCTACAVDHRSYWSCWSFASFDAGSDPKLHGSQFKRVAFRQRIINQPWIRWTPLDPVASRWPRIYDKLQLPSPAEIEWSGLAIKDEQESSRS